MKKHNTSWGDAASWYNEYLETGEDTYQRKVILPNLLRVLSPTKGMRVLDLACGQGFFSREFAHTGATVVGADISKELIAQAQELSPANIPYHVTNADNLSFANDGSFDASVIVLAIQNIENMQGTFAEVARVLSTGGRLILVMMHPAFRVPEYSSWDFDEKTQTQYRRVDRYLSPARSEFLVHPSKKASPITVSYHRSLQDFSKALFKAGFMVSRFEEWTSHKESQTGPRKAAEDTARKEIPLFLMIEATLAKKQKGA